ncbi:MAG: MFS transporter [Bacteroidetes bacterium]|nr:MFS transporter [Bacteroidota bacterium]
MENRKQIFYWSLFDFANSTYATIVLAFVFAIYFTGVICKGEPVGDFYWSLGINIAMIVSAVLNPLCGALADFSNSKKKFLFFFTILAVIPTSLMYFTGEGTILFALVLLILSNIGFQTGLTFYDAFIKEITEEKYYNKVSGIGYAVGYLGSILSVVLVFPLKDNPNLLFLICGVLYFVFSLPLFLFLKEKEKKHEEVSYLSYGFKKVIETLKEISKHHNLKWFLLSYFFFIDAVNTIIFFSGIYAQKTLNFEVSELAIFFLLVQITALLGSLFFGYAGDKIGIHKSIVITLVIWTLITLAVFFTNDKMSFFIIGAFAGTFLGATQSLSRTMMAKLTPYNMKATLFGFYSLLEKTSTLLGPLTFGLVSWLSGSQKLAVLSVGFFFLIGMLTFRKVKV